MLKSRAVHLSVLAVGIALTGCRDDGLPIQQADALADGSIAASPTATPSAAVGWTERTI